MLPDWNYVRQVQGERIVLANAYLDMANRRRAERDYAAAQALYQKVVGIVPHDKVVWTCLGECWTNLAKYARAHACYQQALACDPAFVPALLGLAECTTLQKRPKRALKLLKRAEALMDDEPAANAQLWVAQGNACMMLADPARAERAYRRAMQFKPDYYPPYGNLGNILCERGEHAEARRLYEKAYAMGGDPVMGMNLGIQALLLGDYVEGWRRYAARGTWSSGASRAAGAGPGNRRILSIYVASRGWETWCISSVTCRRRNGGCVVSCWRRRRAGPDSQSSLAARTR